MDKNGNITISYDTWKDGIKTPLTGMEDIVNIDIFDEPGVAKIALAPTALATSNFTNGPEYGAYRPGTLDVYIGDFDGELYSYNYSTEALTVRTDGSSGIKDGTWWKGYMIVTDRTLSTVNLDAYDGSAGTWDNNWDSLSTDTNSEGAFTSIHASPADNDLYIGYGRYIARFSEDTTFDPTSGATYTKIAKFLTLPNGYVIRDITTVANYLVASASLEGSSTTSLPANGARLYFWDLSQTATAAVEWTGFVDLQTDVASPLFPSNNLVYYYDWRNQTFSYTNLSTVSDGLTLHVLDGVLRGSDRAIDVAGKNFVLGLGSDDSATPAGVYTIRGDAYTRHLLSTEETGSNNDVMVNFVTAVNRNEFLVGYEDSTNYIVDHYGKTSYRWTGYKASMVSPLYQVSGSLKKKSYQQLELSLAKELASGEGVRVYYRANLTDDWTLMQTFDFATYGAKSQFNDTAKITDVSTVQFKIEMTTGASSTTTPELISVRVF